MNIQELYKVESTEFRKLGFDADAAPGLFAMFLHQKQKEKIKTLIHHLAMQNETQWPTNGQLVEALQNAFED